MGERNFGFGYPNKRTASSASSSSGERASFDSQPIRSTRWAIISREFPGTLSVVYFLYAHMLSGVPTSVIVCRLCQTDAIRPTNLSTANTRAAIAPTPTEAICATMKSSSMADLGSLSEKVGLLPLTVPLLPLRCRTRPVATKPQPKILLHDGIFHLTEHLFSFYLHACAFLYNVLTLVFIRNCFKYMFIAILHFFSDG